MSKQRKVYAAVMLLAAGGFAVDRFVIGHGPDEAEASLSLPESAPVNQSPAPASSAAPRAATPVRPATSDNSGTIAAAQSLANRLQDVARSESLDTAYVADAFRPSRKWEPEPQPQAAPQATEPAKPVFDPAAFFRATHKLTGIMRAADNGGVAVINGVARRRGEQVSGFTLVEVREHSAVLWSGDVQVVLVLQGFKQSNPAPAPTPFAAVQ